MEILQLQHNKIFNKAKKIINGLRDKDEALYIIDKDLNTQVFFKYKENIYFLSDKFKIDIFTDIIDLRDSNVLIYICEYITNTFANSFIDNSILIKSTDITDKFINDYMIDNLIIKVDRMNRKILEAVSLEYYNDLLLLNRDSISKITSIDNRLVKIDLIESLSGFKPKEDTEDHIDEILTYLYKQQYLFPYNNLNFIETDLLYMEDIIDDRCLLIMANVASNDIISYEIIGFGNIVDYLEIDIQETIEKLLSINKDADILETISYIMMELSQIYQNNIPGFLH